MSASVSGGKTVTRDVAGHLKAATLTTLLATAVENLTVDQYNSIGDALRRIPRGSVGSKTIGSLFV